jgi:hypothetical protein
MSHAPPKISRFEPATVHAPATNARTVRAPVPTRATSARFPGPTALGLIAAAAIAASSSGCMNGGSQKAADAGVTEGPRCVAPEGAPTSPQTVADVLALINALPSPVTLPCFLQALARPLKMHASVSLISAQPSAGARSPRIFLFFDGMRMSIVPAGAGAPLLELGEIREESRSLKAEILFPVTTPLDAATPYQRILYTPTVTRCGFCHPVETPDPDIPFATAFTSVALRPLDSYTVTIDSLANELAICDPTAEPDRCAMLQALFDQGPPVEQPFPADLPTIQ